MSDNELTVRLAACEILAEIGSTDAAVPALKRLTQQETGLIGPRAKEATERIIARTTMPLDLPVGVFNSVNRKVHLGLPIKQSDMLLTEGMFVVGEIGQAIGLGITQTGPETMEFTYLAVIRLPKGNISQTTFASRKQTVNSRIRVSHSAHLGDESLPFEEKEFFIQDIPFSAKTAVFFDISGAVSVVVQRNVDLPIAGSLVALNNTAIFELSDRVLNELIKQNAEARGFLNGAKLVERPAADR